MFRSSLSAISPPPPPAYWLGVEPRSLPSGGAPVLDLGASRARHGALWQRGIAATIDVMVFGIPVGLLYGSSLLPMILDVGEDALSIPEVGDEMLQGVLWVLVLMWLAAWLCETVMTSSSWGATLGKWALGVKIVRSDGAPLGFGRAGLRFFAKTLAAPLVPLWIGYLLAVPSARQRTLHDVIAGTAVVRAD